MTQGPPQWEGNLVEPVHPFKGCSRPHTPSQAHPDLTLPHMYGRPSPSSSGHTELTNTHVHTCICTKRYSVCVWDPSGTFSPAALPSGTFSPPRPPSPSPKRPPYLASKQVTRPPAPAYTLPYIHGAYCLCDIPPNFCIVGRLPVGPMMTSVSLFCACDTARQGHWPQERARRSTPQAPLPRC